jgi:RNA polymerase sigma factor (sigma-70 family)
MASSPLPDMLRHLRALAGAEGGADESDAQLLRRFAAARDEAAFAALLRRHGPLVLGVCRQVLRDPHDAEDAFQATFLVLAKKAGSIREREALGSWLYRVAFNLATTARTSAARRRAREREAGTMAQAPPAGDAPAHDWQPLLHEEVNRLPEKYRVPVVFCYLQGSTHEEAARRLGWPVGTVKGRLARARDLLRDRLARRGLALSAAALTASLGRDAVAAPVPAGLLDATLRAATSFAAGRMPAGAVSALALALAQGALKTMTLTRLAVITLLLFLAGAAGTGGLLLASRVPGPDKPADPRPPRVVRSPVRAPQPRPESEGLKVVLSSDRPQYKPGEPVSLTLDLTNNGTKQFTYPHYKLEDLLGLTVTDPDGKAVKRILNPVEIGRAYIQVLVKPGEKVAVIQGLQGVNLPKAGTDRYLRHSYFPMDAPGRYRLRFQVGEALSNEIVVTVNPEKVGKPAEAKGLKVVVGSDRAEYRAGEPVSLTLTVTNNGKEAFSCMHHQLQLLEGLSVVGPDGKEVKPVGTRAQINFAQIAVTVPPGGTTTVKDGLRGINLVKPEEGTDIRQTYYPMDAPGEYRLRFRVGGATSNELRIKITPR